MTTSERYLPSSLPAITGLVVVDLRGINPNRVNLFMQESASAPSWNCDYAQAQEIARLWRLLPQDEPYRCHSPVLGLRFMVEMEIVCDASICWKCNNIFGSTKGVSFGYNFDGKSETAVEMLQKLKQVIAPETLEDDVA